MKHPAPRRPFLGAAAGSLALAALSPFAAAPAAAADWPTKPVTIVVPYAPGGMGDVFARIVGEKLAIALKQPVIVDNRPGASGAIGTRLVAKAAPDGHTLLLGQTGEVAINQVAMKQPGYDTLRDLEPVILIGDSPLVMVTAESKPYAGLKDVQAAVTGRGTEVSYASSGAGTPGHLAAAAWAAGVKGKAVHVPYKGAGPAMTDVMGGHVDFFFSSTPAAITQIKAGKVRALAVSSAGRLPTLPQVPTVVESGLSGFSFSLWGGVFVPARTPADVVTRLNRELNAIIADPATKARLEDQGAIVKPNTPDEFEAFVRREMGKYEQIVRQTGTAIE
jgi:tripartite-type tricarboxylate transporter receptor subunit TctC